MERRDVSVPVYSPWKMKDIRRLYVNTAEGVKLGYIDLATLDVVPDTDATEHELRAALSALGSTPQATPPANVVTPVALTAPPSSLTWEDLAEVAPAARLAGLEDASYKAGAAAEQRTAGLLAPLERAGYRILHSLPLSPRKDIDHLVIGPSGVFCINTKFSTYGVAAKADGTVLADGYKHSWLKSITRDADLAGSYLSTAARMDIACTPVVAVWSTVNMGSQHRRVVDGAEIAERIRSRPVRFPDAWVDVVFATARRSDTWTAHH